MHGAILDFVTLMTVKDGKQCFTGECWGGQTVDQYQVYQAIKDSFPFPQEQRRYRKILDIGALDINGCMRQYDFLGHKPGWLDRVGGEYIGIDLMAGPNVDMVMNSHKLTFPDASFDLVLCLNMLEHDDDMQKTLSEIYRVLEVGGEFVFSCYNEIGEPHKDLGGGSDHYQRISVNMLRTALKKAGFATFHHAVLGADYLVYAKKEAKKQSVTKRTGQK